MDCLPPDKPVSIAQADRALLAQYHKHTYKFIDVGKMDRMLDPGDWKDAITFEQRETIRKSGLKPGQRVIFARPRSVAEPFFYVTEHQPCSAPTFTMFSSLINSNVFDLSNKQLQLISEILQNKAEPKTHSLQAKVTSLGGRKGINVFWDRRSSGSPYIGRAFYFIADPKKRIVEEFGYEGAKGNDHWRKEAEEMIQSVEFVKPEK